MLHLHPRWQAWGHILDLEHVCACSEFVIQLEGQLVAFSNASLGLNLDNHFIFGLGVDRLSRVRSRSGLLLLGSCGGLPVGQRSLH